MSHYKSGRRSQATSEEARTPIAWQHRDINYHQQGYSDRYRTDHIRRAPASISDHTSNTERSARTKRSSRETPAAAYRGRPPPESETSSTASESSQDTQVPTHAGSRHGGPAMQLVAVPSADGGPPTIRSAQSVPMPLSAGPAGVPMTWDGEPCPVHHPLAPLPPQMALSAGPLSLPPPQHPGAFSLPRASSMYDLRATTPYPGYGPPGDLYHPGVMTIDRKSLLMAPPPPMSMVGAGSTLGRGSLPPGALLPPMMRPRPIVRAEDGAPRELPVRDPRKPSLLPSPGSMVQKTGRSCGGLKRVLLISFAVIVLGVILAVALFYITK